MGKKAIKRRVNTGVTRSVALTARRPKDTLKQAKHAVREALQATNHTRGHTTLDLEAKCVEWVNAAKSEGGRGKAAKLEKAVSVGELQLPEPDQAVAVLRMLAELNDDCLAAYEEWVKAAKIAKEGKQTWKNLAEQLQSNLRIATHKSDLPLFDAAEREEDHAKMLKAGGKMNGEVEDEPIPF